MRTAEQARIRSFQNFEIPEWIEKKIDAAIHQGKFHTTLQTTEGFSMDLTNALRDLGYEIRTDSIAYKGDLSVYDYTISW